MGTISGTFHQLSDAQGAVEELMANGWTQEAISIVTPRAHSSLAVKDAEKGAVIGGLAGLFLGLSEVAVPGVGLVLVGGWIAMTLLGAGMGGVAGGLGGMLAEAGMSHAAAAPLAERVQSGETLVSVRTEASREPFVRAILSLHHAVHIRDDA
ncbi:MAG: hypothetical protein JWL77_4796 [Chthonomonadaceae bacterium]|nr:hypothetical protein [Chthonomonadaceae bacterium]